MNLTEFVEETLSEILAGIRTAQAKEGGGNVGAGMMANPTHSNLLHGGDTGIFTIVEFDVCVAAETSGGAKGGIKVLTFGGIEGGGGHKAAKTSRVKFAVQLRIPQGDKAQRPKGFGSDT
jgi:hypothetical protein